MAGMLNNRQVAAILYEVADLLEIKGVKFKPVAYRRAAHGIETLAEEINRVADRDGLEEVPGVGSHIATKIREILSTGNLQYLERLKGDVGPGVREIAEIGGIGPKKAVFLHQKLGIENIGQLETAAKEGRIRGLFGFGAKSEANILQGIAARKGTTGRFLLGAMLPEGIGIRDELARLPAVRQVSLAGSIRRMKETIGDIDLLAASADPGPVMDAFCSLPGVTRVLGRGATKSSIILASGVQVDLRVVEEAQYWTALQYFTGSKDHNIALRRRALERGWSLSEYGVKETATGKNRAGSTEEDLYRMLDLPFIEPELRENRGEIEAAEKGILPQVVPYGSVKGDLHVHSSWGDGTHSIRELAAAAMARGYAYIAICDHVRSPWIDQGLTAEKIARQRAEIEHLNRELDGFFILHGIECNIGADGSLDLPRNVLADFDLVTAGIHSETRMHGAEMTTRILNALQDDQIDILAHPLGRILLRREPPNLDLPELFRTAAAQHVALEINGDPARLDLPDVLCRNAKEYRITFSACSDAHAAGELSQMDLAIATARRGWLSAEDILNTRPLDGVQSWLQH
ncbi:MAG TPA: DNA polymerase/3'-5' exonuclease PolX [Methanoregula sp.]|nr:DNA polymerase/3'-5' exonuclease PolX [Methanoregula sp.]